MPICTRCRTLCNERDKFCNHCGNLLLTEENGFSCRESWMKMKEEKGDKEEQLNTTDPEEVKKESLQVVLPEEEEIEKPIKRIICPRCKIIYEHGNACIRCGSPLLENPSPAERETPQPPRAPEVCMEKLLLSSGLEAQEKEFKTTHGPEAESEPSHDQSHEPLPLHRLPSQMIQRVSSQRKDTKKGLRFFLELVSIIILIAAPGYLIWSILKYFAAEKPEASISTSLKVDHSISPRPPTAGNSSKPITEPYEITPSMPAHSKRPLAEREELEPIRNLLENIRQANLKKNIDLFMSCYSPAYKDREGKKKETIETWENFNYLHLSYDLKKHSISGNTAQARVEWLIRFAPKAGGQFEESKAVLEVTFKKEADGWMIKEIKTLS